MYNGNDSIFFSNNDKKKITFKNHRTDTDDKFNKMTPMKCIKKFHKKWPKTHSL